MLRSGRLSYTNQGFTTPARCVERRSAPGKTLSSSTTDVLLLSFPSVPRLSNVLLRWLNERRGLPRRSYENSNAFVRRPSAVRPISSSCVPASPRRRLVLLVLAATFSPPQPRPPRGRPAAETCITDSSKLLPLIALLGDTVESRVTVFTSGRRGGCRELFKSFYYAMSIYIHGSRRR